MTNTFKFQKRYFILAVLLFLTELLIVAYAHDNIIRPHVGDFLVVIFLYCTLKSFWNAPPLRVAIAVLIFSYIIEILQYFHLVNRLGLQNSRLATIVLGSQFEWMDLVAYTAGIGAVLYAEKLRPVK